ncbi:MAG: glycosyltransferase family 2 protein [Bacillota bacterium]|nr:glycosyltransferase family 2 protein [Bacillota bacterium]
MENILVSVIIPTYKRAEFLQRAINSVLAQTYKNVEILVVDDNGNGTPYRKETEKFISKLYADNDKIKYIKNENNIGGSYTRNRGAEESTGDYICFLDDDDIIAPKKIEDQLKYMVENDLDLSFTDAKICNQDGHIVDVRDHSRYVKSLDNESLLKYHLLYHLALTDSYMFKRDGFFRTGGFENRFASQEYMLMLNAIERNLKIGYLRGMYAIQYLHEGERISSSRNRAKFDKDLYNIKKQYFYILSNRERRFIRFRYHAALLAYNIRRGRLINACAHGLAAFFISPVYFFRESGSMFLRVKRLNATGDGNGGL